MGESCAVTCVEGYQAANETSGILTCLYEEVAGDVDLEVAVSKGLSVVCSLDDLSTGVHHERPDILSQGSWRTPCTEGYQADGGISTTSLYLSSGEFVGDAPTVNPSCSRVPFFSRFDTERCWREFELRRRRRHVPGVLR